ncbi:conserved exported hypothetical protein [metagenome]|uniref:FMN-binding domain-containing protein n=1 Tax=metagenome TaxID=256318 RepID=A0A2P2CHY0_9ZZZZ
MRRIIGWASTTVTLLVLLFGYHTSTSSTVAGGVADTVISSGPVAGSGAEAAASGAASRVTGDVVQTRYGPVQVQLAVSGGQVSSASVLQYPSGDSRSAQISSYALPVLADETVAAQSSSIDMVSGATFTSSGYIQSLQSALDQAGL